MVSKSKKDNSEQKVVWPYNRVKPQEFSEFEPVYRKNFQTRKIEKVGEENKQEKIQAQNIGLTLEELWTKYVVSGDRSYLEKNVPYFEDVSEFPNNLNEMHEKMQEMQGVLNNVQDFINQNSKTLSEVKANHERSNSENSGNIQEGSNLEENK